MKRDFFTTFARVLRCPVLKLKTSIPELDSSDYARIYERIGGGPELKGRLTNQHMKNLFNAVAGCKTMPQREILLVGNALKAAFA